MQQTQPTTRKTSKPDMEPKHKSKSVELDFTNFSLDKAAIIAYLQS